MQCRPEIILTLPPVLEAQADIVLRENNHYAEMEHKSGGSWRIFPSNIRDGQAIIKEGLKERCLNERDTLLNICNGLLSGCDTLNVKSNM